MRNAKRPRSKRYTRIVEALGENRYRLACGHTVYRSTRCRPNSTVCEVCNPDAFFDQATRHLRS